MKLPSNNLENWFKICRGILYCFESRGTHIICWHAWIFLVILSISDKSKLIKRLKTWTWQVNRKKWCPSICSYNPPWWRLRRNKSISSYASWMLHKPMIVLVTFRYAQSPFRVNSSFAHTCSFIHGHVISLICLMHSWEPRMILFHAYCCSNVWSSSPNWSSSILIKHIPSAKRSWIMYQRAWYRCAR